MIGREIAAAVEFVQVRDRSLIAGVNRNGVPEIGGEAVLRNAAAIAQRFGIEILARSGH